MAGGILALLLNGRFSPQRDSPCRSPHESNSCQVRVRSETRSTGLRAWHVVRVLPDPPRSRTLTEISRLLAKSPELAGLRGGARSPRAAEWIPTAISALCSGLKIPFPGNRDSAKQRLVRMRRYRWERPNWCCSRHSAGKSAKASNPHAMRQPPVDSRLDEVRCKESKRECHIHFSDTAPLALGDGCRSRCCISDQLLEPMAPTGNRCNQCCASFGTDGTSEALTRIKPTLPAIHRGAGRRLWKKAR